MSRGLEMVHQKSLFTALFVFTQILGKNTFNKVAKYIIKQVNCQ